MASAALIGLVLAIVLAVVGFTQMADMSADVTSLTGGLGTLWAELPRLYTFGIVVALLVTLGYVTLAFFLRR